MNNNNMVLEEIQQKIEDMDRKIATLKDSEVESNLKQELTKFLHQLGHMMDKIEQEYNKAIEKESNSDMSEVEKNIYNSIQSFDKAYTEAGHIFKTRKTGAF